ncbi:hypothetical protein IGJ77_001604 [Enterococcus sp. AZ147]
MGTLLKRSKREGIDFIAYYDEEKFIGLAYLITFENLTYLWYLAVVQDLRSQGYGAQVLSHIKENYPDNCIVLNLEAENPAASNNEQRKIRKAFYLRNGYRPDHHIVKMGGEKLEILFTNGVFEIENYQKIFKRFWGPILNILAGTNIVKNN